MTRFAPAIATATLVLLCAAAPAAPEANAPPLDPDWPCQQIKIDHMSLATMWAGPPLGTFADDWQNYPKAAALADRLAERRIPVDQAQAEIKAFADAAGVQRKTELLAFTAGIFSLLDQERFSVIQGLDRFGRRQKSYAAQIRGEITDLHNEQDAPHPDQQKIEKLSQQVYWDTRVFKDRDGMVTYACFVPDEIEHRMFQLAGTVSNLLP
ncbi:MAG TPA: hypothetical protein VMU81_01695 [Acetobacteraceae bacterium]|jgi:hypothetical protein|nr:hypothetical protein [Acetobacteraceae bacterium]